MNNYFNFFQKFWTASIRRQLMLGIILVHAVLMSIFVYDLTSRQQNFLHSQSTEQAKSLSTILAANSVSWVLANDVIGLEETIKSQVMYPSLRYAMVLNPQGRVLGHTERNKVGLYVNDEISRQLLTGKKQQVVLVDNELDVDVATPVTNRGKFIGWARVNLTKKDTTKSLQVITRDGLLYTVLAIVIGAFFAFFMAKGITQGLQKIVDVAEGIKKGHQELRADTSRHDEIGELGKDINMMLDTIEKSRRDLQDIMDNSPAVIYAKDKQGRYIFINQKWENLFDKERKGIVGKTDHEIFEKDFADKFVVNDKAVFATGKSIYIEEVAPHADGIHTYDSVKFPLYDDNKNIYAVCGISTDITERLEIEKEKILLEQQLNHTQKMQAIGQLTGGIAHDFNNLLAVILGYVELSKDLYGKDNKGLSSNLDHIYTAGLRGRELIQQMLIFSRKDQVQEDIVAMELEPVIDENIKMLKATFPSNIEIETAIESDIPPVTGNPGLFTQVLMNLCINAKDAMGGKGKLLITLTQEDFEQQSCHSCHEKLSNRYVVIGIKDNGKGINKEDLNRIFEPFYTSKDVGEGTGMGLSVVHGVLHKFGGHILVSSVENEGTLFQVLLPVAEAELETATEKEKKLPVQYDFSGLFIMLVDDEAGITNVLQKTLSKYHAETIVFNDSVEALAYFGKNVDKVNLVITDQTMPNLLGSELSKKLLALNPGLPIILCTGFSMDISEESANQIGIKSYLQKPLKMEKLLNKIYELK